MKVVNNNNDDNNNRPLTLAEMEALQQFEASNREGQALFHPQVAAGQPVPNCVALFEEVGRFAVTIPKGRYSVEDGQWFRHDADGARKLVDNPLEGAWQAAKSVRTEIKRELDLNTYVIAVLWFPDMEEDEDILEEAEGRSVHLIFGEVDLVQRLVSLPKDDELQTHLSRRYIKQEVAALSRPSAEVSPEPAEDSSPAVRGRVGALVLERVETVNVYITIVYGDMGDDPPLITVRSQ